MNKILIVVLLLTSQQVSALTFILKAGQGVSAFIHIDNAATVEDYISRIRISSNIGNDRVFNTTSYFSLGYVGQDKESFFGEETKVRIVTEDIKLSEYRYTSHIKESLLIRNVNRYAQIISFMPVEGNIYTWQIGNTIIDYDTKDILIDTTTQLFSFFLSHDYDNMIDIEGWDVNTPEFKITKENAHIYVYQVLEKLK